MKAKRLKQTDNLVHIRKRPEAPGIEPAYCGAILVSSVTDAWGYWGPGGDGYAQICKKCEAIKTGKKP